MGRRALSAPPFGRGDSAEPGQRDRTFAADASGLVLVPILAVWLIGKLRWRPARRRPSMCC